ncbi:hypothetical protein Tco_0816395, partial [Tanacetum coccineum]
MQKTQSRVDQPSPGGCLAKVAGTEDVAVDGDVAGD